jgi:hypothetical protein
VESPPDLPGDHDPFEESELLSEDDLREMAARGDGLAQWALDIGRGMIANRVILGDRVHRFVAPIWVVFDALTVSQAKWLRLQPREVEPRVLEAIRLERVVWSSFWPVSPGDTIEFDLSRDGRGTALRFRWFTNSPPDERGIAITRQRLNRKFGGELRGWVDSAWSPVSWERPVDPP